MKKSVLLFVLFFYALSFSQDLEAYNKVYSKTYLETAQKDLKIAFKVADSLYKISETPLLKTRSLMLTASLYKQSGDVKKSIEYALKSGEIIEQTDSYSWQAKVYGFLATQYRMVKLYNSSRTYLEKAFEISENIENPKAANNIKGLMLQEKAYNDIEQKNFKKAIENINRSQNYFKLTEANLDFFTANNEQLLGLSYFNLNDLDQALSHYKKALKFTANDSENFLVGLIYNGFAEVYLEKKDLKSAKKYLSLAERISEKSQYLELKNEIYKTSQKYYAVINDVEKLVAVQKKQDSVVEKIETKSNEFINESFSSLETNSHLAEKKSSNKTWIIIVAIILIVLGAVYIIFSKRKHKRNQEHFKEILADLDQRLIAKKEFINQLQRDELTIPKVISEIPKMDGSVIMNAETEKKLLLKLQEFEESNLFTENTTSLSTLSTYCETNSKYLSYVINTYKKKDFNNYINELRVNYIIKKLKEVPVYRKYKIAVLSEDAGFSSQNKFATVFKKVTTISPSVFIAYLEESDKM